MHECYPKHSALGTARMKRDKETKEKDNKTLVNMERSKAGMLEKKKSRRPKLKLRPTVLPESVDELPNEPN